jgi:phosphoribosyl 1,2-cyclic phosphodiesterase
VLDCGTGARELGLALVATNASTVNLLLSHTHWDHIQGFPFFAPAYRSGARLNIYAASDPAFSVEELLAGQMRPVYFPVSWDELSARLAVHEVKEGIFSIGGITVRAQLLNHTTPCLGYRLEAEGLSVVYATDHAPFWWEGSEVDLAERLRHEGDRRHAEWLAGADLLIHDAQYPDAEYAVKRNWGHSPIEYATDLAIPAGVKRLALFHHDPARTDRAMTQLVRRMQKRVPDRGSNLDVVAASEGLDIELPEIPN